VRGKKAGSSHLIGKIQLFDAFIYDLEKLSIVFLVGNRHKY
jgi:hypothetical protein